MKPYNKEEKTKSEEVREMFDNIAPKYDMLNHTLSAGIDKIWRRKVVNIVKRLKPQMVADIATGTGDLAISIAKRVKGVKVMGIDPSKGMLEVAKKKVNEASLAESITLEVGSAEQLSSISDNTFDAVTVAFGVRNFGNLEQGLKEIFRVLRPGGSVVILEFSNPTNPIISRLYKWYSHKILPRIGGAISKDRSAYEYLPASVDEFPQPKRFTEILTQVGFSDSRARSLSFGIAQIYTAKR